MTCILMKIHFSCTYDLRHMVQATSCKFGDDWAAMVLANFPRDLIRSTTLPYHYICLTKIPNMWLTFPHLIAMLLVKEHLDIYNITIECNGWTIWRIVIDTYFVTRSALTRIWWLCLVGNPAALNHWWTVGRSHKQMHNLQYVYEKTRLVSV